MSTQVFNNRFYIIRINFSKDLSEDEWQSRFVMPTQVVDRKPKVAELHSKIVTTYANSSIDW